MVTIQIINNSGYPLPSYQTTGASGIDLHCASTEPIVLQPLERRLIPTGIYVAIPIGYEAQIRPRSGLALKEGLTVLNTPGTIDADYRGEIGVIMVNLSNEVRTITPGERICQMVITTVEHAELHEVQVLPTTDRAEGGFGHTGKIWKDYYLPSHS